MLDERLAELGAQVSRGPALEPRLEVDGRLVTGQNPASTAAVAQAAVRVMEVRAAAGQ
jgi:putative intracellular protease/amidase